MNEIIKVLFDENAKMYKRRLEGFILIYYLVEF